MLPLADGSQTFIFQQTLCHTWNIADHLSYMLGRDTRMINRIALFIRIEIKHKTHHISPSNILYSPHNKYIFLLPPTCLMQSLSSLHPALHNLQADENARLDSPSQVLGCADHLQSNPSELSPAETIPIEYLY